MSECKAKSDIIQNVEEPFYIEANLRAAIELLDSDRDSLHPIDDVTLADPARVIDGDVFRSLLSFCVYVFIKQGKALYVGYSSRALSRVSNRFHGAQQAIDDCDCVHFYPCGTETDARQLERKLIRRLSPPYNINA